MLLQRCRWCETAPRADGGADTRNRTSQAVLPDDVRRVLPAVHRYGWRTAVVATLAVIT